MTTTPYAGLGPDAEYPEQIVNHARMRGGLRHVLLGEDGETWVFLGHAYHRDVLAAIDIINREDDYGWDVDELPKREDLIYTYAQLIPADPDRASGDVDEDGWSLDWFGGGKDRKANRGKSGYFPIVLWEADQ